MSDESAFVVKWAVLNYLRQDNNVIVLCVLYGLDWGSLNLSVERNFKKPQQKLEDDFDMFTLTKASNLAQPLVNSHIHIVKDHDSLEVERLGLSTIITGSRGFGDSRGGSKG
eukprot:Gb_24194 [translate_table: standard]